MALTPKQERFIQEYLIDLNATQAAIRAGYSPKTANVQGTQNLVKLSNEISKAMNERSTRTEITQDRVLRELAKIAFSDIKNFLSFKTDKVLIGYDDDGKMVSDYQQVIEVKPSEEVDGTMIQEVSISPKGVFQFKLHDKKSALDMIGKHLGMFKDKLELSGETGVKIINDIPRNKS